MDRKDTIRVLSGALVVILSIALIYILANSVFASLFGIAHILAVGCAAVFIGGITVWCCIKLIIQGTEKKQIMTAFVWCVAVFFISFFLVMKRNDSLRNDIVGRWSPHLKEDDLDSVEVIWDFATSDSLYIRYTLLTVLHTYEIKWPNKLVLKSRDTDSPEFSEEWDLDRLDRKKLVVHKGKMKEEFEREPN